MADKRISQLIERTDILNNDVLPIVASGATTTNKVTISTIQEWMQDNLDVGVTSVGITIGSTGTDVNVSGSPITTSGNITINIPTASATNRGLLSAVDWSTFNGKQNSITLTTSGTSGAATLVGSTLNIPNYSTGVANAYVPYVGAIGSVTLGYNSLSASQINIDGASPTGGSYLGFKHSTSVNTGTDGYTSMYTFGTNTIAFKSVSGGNSKDFSFSMVGITPNVAGGRQYTLPDASGTLALTSDLSGYVTIGTTQTITGSKTFNSKIIGQDATLTSSGSTNTLEVFHTSGSGHAVEIQKAGNGEGLRVIKTSGSGNAVTITGGLLSAEAATLTGALNGTSATFSGALTINSNSNSTWAAGINNLGTTDAHGLYVNIGASSTGVPFAVYKNFSSLLTIANSGAATFSSSVSATVGTFLSGSSSTIGLVVGGAGGIGATRQGQIRFGDAGTVYKIQGGEDYSAMNFMIGSGTPLSLASNGAATFSSSVTAGAIISTGVSTFSRAGLQMTVNPSYGGGDVYSQIQSTGALALASGGDNNRLYISSSGNVGIGTASPTDKLHIVTPAGADFQTAINLEKAGGYGNVYLQSYYVDVPNYGLGIKVGNTTAMVVNGAGSVGIGTTSPSSTLEVRGTFRNALSSGAGGQTLLSPIVGVSNGYLINVDTSNNITHTWHTGANATSMHINSVGNVGIGTSSITNNISGTERVLEISNSNVASIYLNSTVGRKYALYSSASGSLVTYDLTGSAARIILDSGGNFGLGYTSPNKFGVLDETSKPIRNYLGNANAQGRAQNYKIVRHIPVTSVGNVLTIPFTSQGNLNSNTIARITGHSARFNNWVPLGFVVEVAVGHLQSLGSLQVMSMLGNASAVSISGMNLQISFGSTYQGSVSDGLYLTIEYMTNEVSYSIFVPGIALN